MAELTIKDIEKAMKQMRKIKMKPAKFYCSKSTAEAILNKAKELGVETKGKDGEDYLLGMKVVTHNDLDDKCCYIEE